MFTSLNALRESITHLPEPDRLRADAVSRHESQLIKPAGSLGRLESLTSWYSTWRGTKLARSHVIIFGGNHGVVAQGVSAWPAEVTASMVTALRQGHAAINQIATSVGATLAIVPVAQLRATDDMSVCPAMTEDAFLAAVNVGYASVSSDIDILVLGEVGIGNTTAAAAICALLYGGAAAGWIGRGAGLDDTSLNRKIDVVTHACALHQQYVGDPLNIARCVGGYELAAAMGATLAARQHRVPIILDGFVVTSAVAPLHVANARALEHCVLGHVSQELGHRRVAEAIGLEPLLDLGLRLGEGTGATLAISILKAALACHTGMARFEDMGIEEVSA